MLEISATMNCAKATMRRRNSRMFYELLYNYFCTISASGEDYNLMAYESNHEILKN